VFEGKEAFNYTALHFDLRIFHRGSLNNGLKSVTFVIKAEINSDASGDVSEVEWRPGEWLRVRNPSTSLH
jgi:hypothetical protein